MINSNEVGTDHLIFRNERFHKSEEIECMLGKYLETRRLSFHQDFRGANIKSSYSCSNDLSTKQSFESGEISLIHHKELHSFTGTSWLAAVIIMANCTIGMSLLNFPYAIMNSGGIFGAMWTQLAILIFIVISLNMVSFASRFYGDVSYQSVIGSHGGRLMKEFCRILIFINNFGALTINLVVIGDQFEHVKEAIWDIDGSYHWLLDRYVMIPLISILLILPLCFLKSFTIFKYSSFLGLLTALYISFGLIMTRYFTMKGKQFDPPQMKDPEHLVKMIPLICFAYECHIEIPPMVACLKKHNITYYQKMIFGYVIFSCIIYTTTGIFGYLTFGDGTPDNILLAYNLHDPLVIIAMILLSVKIVTTYPVVFYCLKIVVEDYLRPLFLRYQHRKYFEPTIKIIISLVLFFSTVLVAIFVPSISSVINLIGGISAIFIFIFPGLCYMKIYSKYRLWNWPFVLFGAFYIVVGTFIMGMCTTQAIVEYVNE